MKSRSKELFEIEADSINPKWGETAKPRVASERERTLGKPSYIAHEPQRGSIVLSVAEGYRRIIVWDVTLRIDRQNDNTPLGCEITTGNDPGCARVCSRPWALLFNAVGVKADAMAFVQSENHRIIDQNRQLLLMNRSAQISRTISI